MGLELPTQDRELCAVLVGPAGAPLAAFLWRPHLPRHLLSAGMGSWDPQAPRRSGRGYWRLRAEVSQGGPFIGGHSPRAQRGLRWLQVWLAVAVCQGEPPGLDPAQPRAPSKYPQPFSTHPGVWGGRAKPLHPQPQSRAQGAHAPCRPRAREGREARAAGASLGSAPWGWRPDTWKGLDAGPLCVSHTVVTGSWAVAVATNTGRPRGPRAAG